MALFIGTVNYLRRLVPSVCRKTRMKNAGWNGNVTHRKQTLIFFKISSLTLDSRYCRNPCVMNCRPTCVCIWCSLTSSKPLCFYPTLLFVKIKIKVKKKKKENIKDQNININLGCTILFSSFYYHSNHITTLHIIISASTIYNNVTLFAHVVNKTHYNYCMSVHPGRTTSPQLFFLKFPPDFHSLFLGSKGEGCHMLNRLLNTLRYIWNLHYSAIFNKTDPTWPFRWDLIQWIDCIGWEPLD